MRTKTKPRIWKILSPLLITLLLITPLIGSAETSGNFSVATNGNQTLPASSTGDVIMQFNLPAPDADTIVHDGSGFAVATGDTLSAFGGTFQFGDVDADGDTSDYSGVEIIVNSPDVEIDSSEVVTPGTAGLVNNWTTLQNIQFGDEDHDGAADYDGTVTDVIVVDSADASITNLEVVHDGLADLTAFPATYNYLETDADSTFDDGEDIIEINHNGANATADGDTIYTFGAVDYYSDTDVSTDYTDGEAIISSGDAALHPSDTVTTSGTLWGVSTNFCGAAPSGTCSYYDHLAAGVPYCVVDDADSDGTISTNDILISDGCGTGNGDNHTYACGAEGECGNAIAAIPATDSFIDDGNPSGNGQHNSAGNVEFVWRDANTNGIYETGEGLFGWSTWGLTSLSGSTTQFFNDNNSNNTYNDGEDIFDIYYAGSANNVANGDTIRTFDAAEKFSDQNNDGDYSVTGVTGNTELIANTGDAILANGEIVTAGGVDLTSFTVGADYKYAETDGDGLLSPNELIAESADLILQGSEIRLDGDIDLNGFAATFLYHDGSGGGSYSDGEDIVTDDDGSGLYSGTSDRLDSIMIGNPGTCADSALAGLHVYEDTDGNDSFDGTETQIGTIAGAPFTGIAMNTSGAASSYTDGANAQTIFVVIDTAAPAVAANCTVTPILSTGTSVQFLSGDDGPTNANVTTADTTTIDLQAPTPTVARIITTKTETAGGAGVANATDVMTVGWDAATDGHTDVASVSADFADFGGGVIAMRDDGAGCDATPADNMWCAEYTVAAGAIDDTDNDVTLTLATDAAGNVAGDVTDDVQFSVDNQAPTVAVGQISVAGGSAGGGTIFLSGDTPIPTWDSVGNGDIATVTFDASAFRTGDNALVGTNPVGTDWIASLSGAMSPQDTINNNITVTVVDDGGNAVALAGTNNYTIDTFVPTPTPANITTTKTEVAGNGAIANPTDIMTVVWDAGTDGHTDVASVSANYADFGGGVIAMRDDGAGCDPTGGDDIWCATYTVVAGTIDDTDNDVTLTLATDDAGNVAGDVTDDIQFSVDNEAPAGAITVTGANGTGGAFKVADIPVPTWTTAQTDIVSVSFVGTDFRAAEGPMAGTEAPVGTWTGTFTGPIDSQDDLNNNVSITATDDAGNVLAVAGTNNYTVDNQLPSFTAVNTVEALQQSGAAPTISTQLWYYYTGQNLRIQLNNASESDGNDLASVKGCMRSMNEDSPTQLCSAGDFAVPANYQAFTVNPGADNATLNYALAGLGAWPTQVDGYEMNFELTDDAGNVWQSSNAAEFYYAVFNVIPQNMIPALNNGTTTDWSTITDFTNVPAGGIVFNAQDTGVDVARMTFNAAMDLTDQATVTGLSALATNVSVDDSVVRVDSSALAEFDIATQLMVKSQSPGNQPGFAVKDDVGAVIGSIPATAGVADVYNFAGHGTATNFVWNGGTDELTFDVTGFSAYEADTTPPTASISPASGTTGVTVDPPVVVTFSEPMDTASFTYTHSPNPGGLSVVWSAGDTVATISHSPYANGTAYTFSITGGNDLAANAIAPTSSTFTTLASASSSSSGGGGGGGSAAFGSSACSGDDCDGVTDDEETTPEEGATEEGAEEGTPDGQFSDTTDHWAAPFIEQAKNDGYVDGYADDTFKPDQQINRAEAAKLIAMWMAPDLAECTESAFSDVSCTQWFGKFVMYLKLMEVIEGYDDGTFRPEASITRAEALKMMLYAKGISPDASGLESMFSDVSEGDWFYAVVLKGYSMGIINGYTDGTFGPNQPITRAEFTKIFVNTFLN